MAKIVSLPLLLAVMLGAALDAHAQQVALRASVLSTGSGESNSGGVYLQSTLGQTIIGRAAGAAYIANAGFWYQVKPTASPVVLNSPPTAPRITSPEDGAAVVLGGGVGEDPEDPGEPFTVTWAEAVDPEGDPVVYTWQLSGSADFAEVALEEHVGATPRYETTQGALVARFDIPGVTMPGDASTIWHRVVASDGQLATASVAYELTFVRGTFVATEEDAEGAVPTQFVLEPNYPNPFNPETTITYALPEATPVRVVVYDLFGRAVRTLVQATQGAGRYEVRFEAGDLASGTYFYRIEAGAFQAVRRMMLVK